MLIVKISVLKIDIKLFAEVCLHVKSDMKSYIPLEMAAIIFSSEPISKTGY